MRTREPIRWMILTGTLFLIASPTLAGDDDVNLGSPLSQAEGDAASITIFPDGRGLPNGRGSVRDGKNLYRAQCSSCHGKNGIEGPAARLAGSDGFISLRDPLRPLRIKKYPLLVLSVGAQWPYATSIFDYIRRAMPHTTPKSLSNDEVYAVTAYILNLNDLVADDVVLTRETLPSVEMPGLSRTADLSSER